MIVVPGGVGLDADGQATNLGEGGAALTAAFLADALAVDLIVPRIGAGSALDQVPGRKARLLARDRRVHVRVIEPAGAAPAGWRAGQQVAGSRAVPA